MRECLGKHSCTSSSFPIAMLQAILNGAFFFSSFNLVQENLNIAPGIAPEVAVKTI